MDQLFSGWHWPSDSRPMLMWIVLLPLLGAMINGLTPATMRVAGVATQANKNLVSSIAVGTVFTSFLLALYCFITLLGGEDPTERIQYDFWEWFQVTVGQERVPVRVRFVMDHLSGIMTVMVTGIATLIHVYSTEYMGDDPSYPRFMTYLNLFTASMLVLVLASNLPLMFVGWEGVGLCSYLLIGFWWTNPAYAAAGRKAFVVNRIGDFGVLIGTFLLLSYCHTFEFNEINGQIQQFGRRMVEMGAGGTSIGVTLATAAALFLFLGCTGKSAQLPLYVWLPDAMAGPTPVSALIHAATMVTAGVYLCCRLSNVFLMSEVAMATIAVVGSLTALLGASIGLVQNQMKKILAYSTVSQLGFMFAAVGCGAFAAGFFHVFTHAFFKACLFLGAGSVMHAVHAHGDADIRELGGMRKFMPRTHATFAIACLAIAGFPLTSGFFSKDEILAGALEATEHLGFVGWFVFVVLAVTAFLTACYMFRLYFLTFWGDFRGGPKHDHGTAHGHDEEHAHEPHESGDAVTIPLMLLAFGALVVGFLGIPHWVPLPNWWAHWLTGTDEHHGVVSHWPATHSEEHGSALMTFLPVIVGTSVGLAGIALAYVWYANKASVQPAKETGLLRGVVGSGALLALGLGGYGFYRWDELPVHGGAVPMAFGALGLSTLIALAGFAAWVVFNPSSDAHGWAMDKWRVDEFYGTVLVRPMRWLSVLSAHIDRIAVDGLLVWVPSNASRAAGWVLSKTQNGLVYIYATGLTVGTAVLVWWFTAPHTSLVPAIAGATVTWSADPGPGYEYRWDFDSDGTYDSEWSGQRQAEHTYGAEDSYYGLVAIVHEAGAREEPREIALGESSVPVASAEAGGVLGSLSLDGADVVIHSPEAPVSGARLDENRRARVRLGSTVVLGNVSITIAARARATVQVRNAFGNLAVQHEEATLRLPNLDLERVAEVTR